MSEGVNQQIKITTSELFVCHLRNLFSATSELFVCHLSVIFLIN